MVTKNLWESQKKKEAKKKNAFLVKYEKNE